MDKDTNKNIIISDNVIRALTNGHNVAINDTILIPNNELKKYRLIDNELYNILINILVEK